jgi:hypothetical protein
MDSHEEFTVTNCTSAGVDKNELRGTSARRGIESSICASRVLTEEVYGGGSEYFPFEQLPHWPFGWIRMSVREEE